MIQLTSFSVPVMIAYFSMDVAIDSDIPTYSGGLGILSGDTLRSAADLGVPMVAFTLLHRKGYFDQRLDAVGNQLESPSQWSPEKFLEPLPARVSVFVEGREVKIRAWQHRFHGVMGHTVPLLLLDTDLEDNDPRDRILTDHLYGGDDRYRLCQEAILGLGGGVQDIPHERRAFRLGNPRLIGAIIGHGR
jgi:starch phosphorylase